MTLLPVNNDGYLTLSPAEAESSASAWGGGIFEILFLLLVFICILFLAYVVTRFVARRSVGRIKSRHIEIIDTLAVGADAQLMVIKAGGEYFLASKSQKLLTIFSKLELTPEDVREAAVQTGGFAGGFRSILESKLGFAQPRQQPRPGADFRGNIGRIKGFSETPEDDRENPPQTGGQDE